MNVKTRMQSLVTFTMLTACLFLMMLAPTAFCDVVLFSDNFEEGNADNWEIIEYGEWSVTDGQYCLHTV